MQKIVTNSSATVAYSTNLKAAFKLGNAIQHTNVKVDDKFTLQNEIIYWGVDNLFPQNILKECKKNTIIGTTLDKQARIAYEAGLAYGFKKVVNGEEVRERVIDPVVEAFLRRSLIHRYLIQSFREFYWFYNNFPELVLTADRSQIYSIKAQKAAHCRHGKQNKSGIVETCYISAEWELSPSLDGEYVEKVPEIDIYRGPDFVREGSAFKYIYPISYPSEDETFYSLTDWNSLRVSGWLEVVQAIPQFKKALFENQITIKHIIEVSTWWWNWKYQGFDNFDAKKKKALMDQELERFEKFMRGKENAGNSLMVTNYSDPDFQKEYSGWKISPVDNKIKDGIYIEDSNEGSSHLLYALGIDPAIIGSQPGSKLGAGSGSDKRVAFNIYADLLKAHQDLQLEPFYFIAEYNGWPQYDWWFQDFKAFDKQPSKSPLKETDPKTEPNQQAS